MLLVVSGPWSKSDDKVLGGDNIISVVDMFIFFLFKFLVIVEYPFGNVVLFEEDGRTDA